MGLLTQEDSKLYRGFFKEMAKLRGIEVFYYYVKSSSTTIHSEFKTVLSEPQKLDIVFIENPKINTLKRIGWVSENPNDKPYIALLPFDTHALQAECVIEIPPDKQVTLGRKFKITQITTLLEYPDCFTCTLAPIFNNDPEKTDYSGTNYNYVQSSDQPNQDSPDNKIFNNTHSYDTYNYIKGN